MKNLTIVALSLLLVSSVLFMAFKPAPATSVANDHVVIIRRFDNAYLFVSENGSKYEQIKINKKDYDGGYDMNSCINIVKKYEADGYEIQSISGDITTVDLTNTKIWMTRKK